MAVKESNEIKNVFKGSGSGLFTTNYRGSQQSAKFKLKPEQVDGDLIVSDGSLKSGSPATPGVRYSPDKLQTIYD